jgi:hypothetical protein
MVVVVVSGLMKGGKHGYWIDLFQGFLCKDLHCLLARILYEEDFDEEYPNTSK